MINKRLIIVNIHETNETLKLGLYNYSAYDLGIKADVP